MRNLTLETRIVDLHEYLELAGFANAKEALEEVGVVAQEYAYSVGTEADDGYYVRSFAPVLGGNYKEAVARTVDIVMEDYRYYLDRN